MSDDERGALVDYARTSNLRNDPLVIDMADLIEADGKRLALADDAPHERSCLASDWNDWSEDRTCTCWKAEYDAAKEAGL